MKFLSTKFLHHVSLASAATLLTLGIAGLYVNFVGIPKTTARSLYNQAQAALVEKKVGAAIELMTKAAAAWPEPYIVSELEKLRAL